MPYRPAGNEFDFHKNPPLVCRNTLGFRALKKRAATSFTARRLFSLFSTEYPGLSPASFPAASLFRREVDLCKWRAEPILTLSVSGRRSPKRQPKPQLMALQLRVQQRHECRANFFGLLVGKLTYGRNA